MRSPNGISGSQSPKHKRLLVVLAGVLLVCLSSSTWAETIVTWDFTQGAQGWIGNDFVKDLTAGSEGLAFISTGIDPWIEGPAADLPEGQMTRVTVTMKSDADAGAELFYGRYFEARRSVRCAEGFG